MLPKWQKFVCLSKSIKFLQTQGAAEEFDQSWSKSYIYIFVRIYQILKKSAANEMWPTRVTKCSCIRIDRQFETHIAQPMEFYQSCSASRCVPTFINALKRQGAANGPSPQLVKVLMLNKTDRILKNARRSQWNLNKISQVSDFHQYR